MGFFCPPFWGEPPFFPPQGFFSRCVKQHTGGAPNILPKSISPEKFLAPSWSPQQNVVCPPPMGGPPLWKPSFFNPWFQRRQGWGEHSFQRVPPPGPKVSLGLNPQQFQPGLPRPIGPTQPRGRGSPCVGAQRNTPKGMPGRITPGGSTTGPGRPLPPSKGGLAPGAPGDVHRP